MPMGGVAIMVHEDLESHISHIHRIDHRIIKITLQSTESHTPITIINTYAPHTGRSQKEKQEHWQKARETIQQTPKNI